MALEISTDPQKGGQQSPVPRSALEEEGRSLLLLQQTKASSHAQQWCAAWRKAALAPGKWPNRCFQQGWEERLDTSLQISPVLLTWPRPHGCSVAFLPSEILPLPVSGLGALLRHLAGRWQREGERGAHLGPQPVSSWSENPPAVRPSGDGNPLSAVEALQLPAVTSPFPAAARPPGSRAGPAASGLRARLPRAARRAARSGWGAAAPEAPGRARPATARRTPPPPPQSRPGTGRRGELPLLPSLPPSALAEPCAGLWTAGEGALPCALPLPSPAPSASSSGHWDWWINHDVAAVNAFMWSGLCRRLEA